MKEAKKRGLPNSPDTPQALKAFIAKKNIKVLEKYNVLSETEVNSRYEVFMDEYKTKVQIEGELALDMARTMIMPVAIRQQSEIVSNLKKLFAIEMENGLDAQVQHAQWIGNLITSLSTCSNNLEKAVKTTNSKKILSCMAKLRKSVDELEGLVSDEYWPLPKYSEMLFIY